MFKLLASFIVLITLFVFSGNVEAKVLPRSSKNIAKPTTPKSGGSTTIGVYPKLRADRKALIVNFANLQNAKAVSYMLVYKTSQQEEAAMGGLNLNGQSTASTELLFATCSKNVCRYHTNIHDARLEVSYTSKTGKKYLKKFRIKV